MYLKENNINLYNFKLLAKKMHLLHSSAFIFIVGGTNGKGTVCYFLEKIFINSGYRVGLYTSPHLLDEIERVRINGQYVERSVYQYAFSLVRLYQENFFLTYFEFITLVALVLFKDTKLDVIILEVGLGGRLDATNIINTDLSIITNVGIDHVDFLGSTRSSIGFEKAHIARKNKFIIFGEYDIPGKMAHVIKNKQAILKLFKRDWFIIKNKNNWSYVSRTRNIYNISYPNVSLNSISVALTALFCSPFIIYNNVIIDVIKNIVIPGRFQIISQKPKIILDVGHNPHAILNLSKKIKKISHKRKKIYVIMGILKDKDFHNMILNLIEVVDYWYTAPIDTIKGFTWCQLNKILPNFFNICKNVQKVWDVVQKRTNKEDVIVVCGSFYLVSEIMKIMKLKVII
ncbi:bifunctional tetrahydrofolate synthase/dihydrofolate synthase [Buchnera aphidicola (Formosaphis micheliae)]|uniref:bifunctional tetrahydrofolate synthase/dihydrofolate synthase n=1 Tax=Buchnera aphidicola TaxID=9 RepID=UPI0031CC388F